MYKLTRVINSMLVGLLLVGTIGVNTVSAATLDTTNYAQGGTAEASHQEGGNTASKAIDGNDAWESRWCTNQNQTANEWLKVTLKDGVTKPVKKVEITFQRRKSGGQWKPEEYTNVTGYKIEAKGKDGTFNEIAKKESGVTRIEVVELANAVETNELRITILSVDGRDWANVGICEFKVFAEAAPVVEANKEELNALITEYSSHTVVSKDTFLERALDEATKVRDNVSASQEEVDKVVLRLKYAYQQQLISDIRVEYPFLSFDAKYNNYTTDSIVEVMKINGDIDREKHLKFVADQETEQTLARIVELRTKLQEAITNLVPYNGTGDRGLNENVLINKVVKTQGEFTVLGIKYIQKEGKEVPQVKVRFNNTGIHPIFGEYRIDKPINKYEPFPGWDMRELNFTLDIYDENLGHIGSPGGTAKKYTFLDGTDNYYGGFEVTVDLDVNLDRNNKYITMNYAGKSGKSYYPGYYTLPEKDTVAPQITGTVDGGVYNTDVTLGANDNVNVDTVEINGVVYSWDKANKVFSNDGEYTVVVKDYQGNSAQVKFTVDKTAPEVSISYAEKDAKTVIATITSNEPMQEMEGWTLSEDKLTATKDYAADYTGEVVVKDLAGNVVNVVLNVVMPDVTAPEVSISYAEKDAKTVTATITSNEPMQAMEGWTLSEDKLTATKDFTTDYTGKVLVKDLAGNTTELDVKVVMPKDTTAPKVTVDVAYSENGKLSSVMIYTNEVCKQPEGWLLQGSDGQAFRKEFTKNGTYTVVVEDLAGNTTALSFEISGIKEEAKPTPTPQPTDKPTKPESTVKPTVKPEPTKKPVANGNGGYDDGGPFTTDKCGSVYDRWGNLMWKAPVCNAHTNDGYTIVNTSDR